MGAVEIRLVPEAEVSPEREFAVDSPDKPREKLGFDGSSNPSTRVDRPDMIIQGRLVKPAPSAEQP